jgi:CRP-like cAMP-binding protein
MERNQLADYLGRVPLFDSLKRRQLENLARRFVERDYPAGKAIVTQGAGGEGFFVVVTGEAQAERERADGTKTVVNHFAKDDFFGELALLDDGLRTASVVALTPVRCLILTRWDFLAVLKEDPEIAIEMLQTVTRRFRMMMDAMQ